MTMPNAFSGAAPIDPETAAMVARRDRLLGPAYRLFYDRPVHPVRGEGVWLYEADGSRLLDAYNNVVSVGHCHPRVVEAICRQAALLNTHTRYLGDEVLELGERLLATLPGHDYRIMFTCTGSEANDLAVRIARMATGRSGGLVTANAYHGVTQATAELSPSLGPDVERGPAIRAIAAPPFQGGTAFADAVTEGLCELERGGHQAAFLIADTIFSSDGVIVDGAGFLASAAERMRAAGGLFIADEVQAGFARTGSHFWGFARHGEAPDIVTMGKPMGNGHPIAAVAARADLLEAFGARTRYFNTFGGNPVSCASALAVLDVIEEEGLLANSATRGTELRDGLTELARRDGRIGAVRGAGLFLAADIIDESGRPDPAGARWIVNALRERGVLISVTGPSGHILKIRPPLIMSADEAALFLDTMEHVLGK